MCQSALDFVARFHDSNQTSLHWRRCSTCLSSVLSLELIPKTAMEHEEEFSDASLIEDDEEEEIDLPDEVIMDDSELPAEEANQDSDSDEDFHGFQAFQPPQKPALFAKLDPDFQADLTEKFNENDMDARPTWFPEPPLADPDPAPVPEAKIEAVKPPITEKVAEIEAPPEAKKAKKMIPPATPSPLLQRESREWKPSSQFFKPLHAGWVREVIYDRVPETGKLCNKAKEVVYHVSTNGKSRMFKSQAELRPYLANMPTLTLHNFSFRNDPLNAPKGQEIIRATDEIVEIFPAKQGQVEQAVKKTPSTSLNPMLPSGLLKVKMFGKMKEKNTLESASAAAASAASNSSFYR